MLSFTDQLELRSCFSQKNKAFEELRFLGPLEKEAADGNKSAVNNEVKNEINNEGNNE